MNAVIQVDPSLQGQVRRACDTCHRNKVKCTRNHESESGPCQRCQQTGSICVFSVAKRNKRQSQPLFGVQDASKSNNNDVDNRLESVTAKGRAVPALAESLHATSSHSTSRCFDGPIERLDVEMTGNRDLVQSHSADATLYSLEDSSAASSSTDICLEALASIGAGGHQIGIQLSKSLPVDELDIITWTAKMAGLNALVTQHLKQLPSVKSAAGSRTARGQGEATSAEGHHLDVTSSLKISEELADFLTQTLERLPPCARQMEWLTKDSSLETPPRTLSLDPASELLMISTYLRLIEIHDNLLHRIQEQLNELQLQDRGLRSSSSSPGSHLHPIVSLVDSNFSRIQDLIRKILSPKDTSGYRGGFDCFGGVSLVIVPDLAVHAIHVREAAIFSLLSEVKRNLSHNNPVSA